jgi:N-acetylglutamate synthase-like GNAT family acetyltransferase
MKNKFEYRLMKSGEENIVYDLILDVFHKYVAPTYSQEGVDTFLTMLSVDFLKDVNQDQFSIIAEYANQIIGVLSIIKVNHIALLFVKPGFQGQSVGKGLIRYGIHQCSLKHKDIKSVTVSSTPNSLTFYENIGFKIIDEEKNENGMRFIPMEKKLNISVVNLN